MTTPRDDPRIPAPLTSGHLCPDCGGTGADAARTAARPRYESGYVRCRTCNGNGLDPIAYDYPRRTNEDTTHQGA